MKSKETRDRRPLILLAVLMAHFVIVVIAMRAARLVIATPNAHYEPLFLMFLMFLANRAPTKDTVTRSRTAESSRAATRTSKRGRAGQRDIDSTAGTTAPRLGMRAAASNGGSPLARPSPEAAFVIAQTTSMKLCVSE